MARNKLKYRGRLYDRLSEAIVYRSVSLMYETLDPGTLQASVESEGREWLDFALDEPVVSYYQDRQDGVYYLQDVRQTAWNKYTIYATRTLGLLLKRPHKGGYYNGQEVEEVVQDICGPVPVYIKTVYKSIKLYGWLPYVKPPAGSARDNLLQVLFAIGADLATDLDGVLRVEPLWDGVSGSIHGRMGVSTSLQRETAVTGVQVIEHQWLEGGDTITLFEGTTVQGQEITFSEPAYGLTATGFVILERGVNYAVVSAGTGTLTGRAYRHNTRTISRGIYSGNKENIVTIDNMTLVSLVNSADAAHRMLSYYTCRELVDTPYIYQGEEAGDRLVSYDPFSRTPVQACMESAEITLSNQLLAAAKLRVGYIPPQPETAEYYDTRKTLTGSGQFVVPEGVTTIRYILIQGGQGGKAGRQGGKGSHVSVSFSVTPISQTVNYTGYGPGPGGAGGLGGDPGHGGRVLEGEMSVTPGQVIPWNCGIGGLGAVVDANNPDAEGQEGGHTTFGPASTASGSYTPSGWTDLTTGETYGLPGLQGLPGAKGAGQVPGNSTNTQDDVYRVSQAEDAVDEDGVSWAGGVTELDANGWIKAKGDDVSYLSSYLVAGTSIALGSGAAAGTPGASYSAYGAYHTELSTAGTVKLKGYAYGPMGLAGATPSKVPHKASATNGGRGGYGGGGGSSPGLGLIGKRGLGPFDVQNVATQAGSGGNGGQGGQGGDGLIILYYSAKIELPSGALSTADGWWFADRLGRWFVV